jgi:hypothetical protein
MPRKVAGAAKAAPAVANNNTDISRLVFRFACLRIFYSSCFCNYLVVIMLFAGYLEEVPKENAF